MKFKVGDRVKFVKSTIYHTKRVKLGRIYTVATVDRRQYLVNCEEKYKEFFEEEELEPAEYTYEDLKKAPIGTKITFESGKILIKDDEGRYENSGTYRLNEDLEGLKDDNDDKIIKIEEPTYSTVYEYKPEILDEAEKRYLSNFIRPFKDSVETIRRLYSPTKEKDYIQIRYKDDRPTNLPYFESDTMYKKMEINKNYTLEELGL